MSRNITTTQLNDVLSDYAIRLTGDNPSSSQEPISNAISNPPNWPTAHRRIPNFRPIDRNRDAESRPNATGFERVFLTIMFSGVVLNATSAKIWGATGGSLFPDLFKYVIGGEW